MDLNDHQQVAAALRQLADLVADRQVLVSMLELRHISDDYMHRSMMGTEFDVRARRLGMLGGHRRNRRRRGLG